MAFIDIALWRDGQRRFGYATLADSISQQLSQRVIGGGPHRKCKATTSTKNAMRFCDGKLWIQEVMYAKTDHDTIKRSVRDSKCAGSRLIEAPTAFHVTPNVVDNRRDSAGEAGRGPSA